MNAGTPTGARSAASGLARGRLAAVLIAASLAGIGIGFGVHVAVQKHRPTAITSSRHGLDGEATWAAGVKPAPAIDTLRDQTGRVFSLASLRGRTVAVVFFDSYCHQECPLEGRDLAQAERSIPAAQRPVLVAVSVNPLDTPASAARAARAWGLTAVAPWHWLMGTRRQLASVWSAYHIYVASHPVNGDIAHTEAVYLVDRKGYERSAYLYPFAPRFVTHDLVALGRGSRS
jgi:cytochrome oxidase Cu insertion factor (SCO1/SenC/PrrC family)